MEKQSYTYNKMPVKYDWYTRQKFEKKGKYALPFIKGVSQLNCDLHGL